MKSILCVIGNQLHATMPWWEAANIECGYIYKIEQPLGCQMKENGEYDYFCQNYERKSLEKAFGYPLTNGHTPSHI